MSFYASGTRVSVDRSKGEIEGILKRYGASAFGYMADTERAVIQFQARERRVRFVLPLPDPERPDIRFHVWRDEVTNRERTDGQRAAVVEQETRQRWRALTLAIKAKMEAVESGITSFEDEFMAHIILPGGKTVSEMITPSIESAYKDGKVPNLLAWSGK